ncbi:MAG TPA: 1,2-phenylacetyl-CoA epoxidase subunit PaaC [Gemmatimonadaceae bacterium]|jgi:ring-1,2-phenylacetyl-CoA epoxidase subunit PaaC|nr:1,2-phenylacetyl-CoA epoxidase subunit PaaC [Gemmatimonadaceae bacterium]
MSTPALVPYLLRLGDDRLVLGHRLSEWCGHGPILEEDIAITNIALDLIGEAALLLKLAGEEEGQGRDEDALAYFRDAVDYRNALMVELPKGDFGFTIVRQFLFSAYSVLQMEALQRSKLEALGGIAAKALKESRYHLRHSAQWVITLGDGTEESHDRAQRAVDELWRYTGELFAADEVDREMAAIGMGVDPSTLAEPWQAQVGEVVLRAGLTVPTHEYMQQGGRVGRHTEHLGHMLAEMQIVARSHPGAKW